MAKLKKISPLNTGRWEINVISPKGFSEAVRLSFYRANAARNALLENPAIRAERIHVVYPGIDFAGIDQRSGDDGQRATFFHFARGTKETLGALQSVRVHTT